MKSSSSWRGSMGATELLVIEESASSPLPIPSSSSLLSQQQQQQQQQSTSSSPSTATIQNANSDIESQEQASSSSSSSPKCNSSSSGASGSQTMLLSSSSSSSPQQIIQHRQRDELRQDPTFESVLSSDEEHELGGGTTAASVFRSRRGSSSGNSNRATSSSQGGAAGGDDNIRTDPSSFESIEEERHRREGEGDGDDGHDDDDESNKPVAAFSHVICGSRDDNLLDVLYLSAFAVLGTAIRIYLGRFFGLDCDLWGRLSTTDVLFPWFSKICVTNSGRSMQTGGALFTDLPANMVGCFLMGMLSPSPEKAVPGHSIPWLHPEHRLQSFAGFLTALTTGCCGCITTFASWNTQMVVMLDGTDNPALGPQVAPALFGYLIGIHGAIGSFVVGRHVHGWCMAYHQNNKRAVASLRWRRRQRQQQDQQQGEPLDVAVVRPVVAAASTDETASTTGGAHATTTTKQQQQPQQQQSGAARNITPIRYALSVLWNWITVVFGIDFGPFVIVSALFAVFAVGDAVYHDSFYRTMWLTGLLSPFGAMLRWKLSPYNARRGYWKHLEWVPWGTFWANMMAVTISIVAEVCEARYLVEDVTPGYSWWIAILPAIETGFAGSLSTVSTWVKEICTMKAVWHSYVYCLGCLTLAMFLGLLFYSPIIRS